MQQLLIVSKTRSGWQSIWGLSFLSDFVRELSSQIMELILGALLPPKKAQTKTKFGDLIPANIVGLDLLHA